MSHSSKVDPRANQQPLVAVLKKLLPVALHPYPLFCRWLALLLAQRVASGPFAGMWIGETATGSYRWPRALGTYELELHSELEELLQSSFSRLVNVGGGDGYYAVGMLLRCPHLDALVFETEPAGQAAIRSCARHNNVDSRIAIAATCTPDLLEQALLPHSLLIMDVEGAERELLDTAKVPALRTATILVELHEFAVPGIGQALRDRFASSHTISEISTMPRRCEQFPPVLGLPRSWIAPKYLLWAMEEGRPGPMSWLLLRPKKDELLGRAT